jgi:fructosamine-3-kinase
MWTQIEQQITNTTGEPFKIENKQSVGGGCINEAWRISGSGHDYFVKLNSASGLDMFEAEAEGLHEMASANAIRVPEPVVAGVSGNRAFLVMEYIKLGGRSDPAAMGEQLAEMHKKTSERFGWHRDNTIGSTPQVNRWEDDWVTFWREHRLGFQLQLAGRKGIGSNALRLGERLLADMDAFFSGHQPVASILHGDLWGGNASADAQGNPVIFDPATYYGDRETDLAMTELFGGFGGGFYSAYQSTWPLDPGYPVRKTLYNLYQILNHFNLFGGGYGMQAEGMMERLISDIT